MVTGWDLPSNLVLSEGETVTGSKAFKFIFILFWLRTRVALTDRRLVAQWPRLRIMGTIPIGSKEVNIPLTQIASISAPIRIHDWITLIKVILFVFVGLVYLTESVGWGIGFILFGLLGLDSTIQTSITVTHTDGGTSVIEIYWSDRRSAKLLADEINTALADRPG